MKKIYILMFVGVTIIVIGSNFLVAIGVLALFIANTLIDYHLKIKDKP